MNLTFQVPMQYCSLLRRTLLPTPVTSTTGCNPELRIYSSFLYPTALLFVCVVRRFITFSLQSAYYNCLTSISYLNNYVAKTRTKENVKPGSLTKWNNRIKMNHMVIRNHNINGINSFIRRKLCLEYESFKTKWLQVNVNWNSSGCN